MWAGPQGKNTNLVAYFLQQKTWIDASYVIQVKRILHFGDEEFEGVLDIKVKEKMLRRQ